MLLSAAVLIGVIKAIMYGIIMLIGTIISRVLSHLQKRQTEQISFLTKERDDANKRAKDYESSVRLLRTELELCRFTYVNCFLRLQQMEQFALEQYNAMLELDADSTFDPPDTSDLPQSLSELLTELKTQLVRDQAILSTKEQSSDDKSHGLDNHSR